MATENLKSFTLRQATSRAFRNNNPLNIRLGDPWLGLAPEQNDPDFCQFTDAFYGFRAGAVILLKYRQEGFTTLASIIKRWAPPGGGNDTNAYILDVRDKANLPVIAPLDVTKYATAFALVKAMATHEAGDWYWQDGELTHGLAGAGIFP